MRSSLLPTAVLLTLAVAQTAPSNTQAPQTAPPAPTPATDTAASTAATPLEKLRYNPRERTEHGMERLQAGDGQGAVQSFETAGRLAADDPVARFNAGTVDLLTGAEGAVEHLEFAAETATPELAPAARFNLGNARLAGGDTTGAIEDFKESLRLDPTNRDVKHNLELALEAQQQQQQQEQEQQQQQQEEQQQDEQQPQDQQQQDDPNEEGERDQEQQQPGEAPPQDQPQQDPGDQKLPDFEDQPDMSAEQAAAILEAVENLERDERRRQAEERARKKSKKGKDW